MGKVAGIMGFAAGLLLVAGGITGSAMWLPMKSVTDRVLTGDLKGQVGTLLLIFAYLSAAGGAAVAVGGALVYHGRVVVGKLLMMLGMGLSIWTVVLGFATVWWRGGLDGYLHTPAGIGGIGVLLALIARRLA